MESKNNLKELYWEYLDECNKDELYWKKKEMEEVD